ncbi:hypothetical protein HZA76_00860 [Candidatus Roizmanbacteria bacterium]|nr:hypothetical protein [Candidatus Roizmanbacteria bacterium]
MVERSVRKLISHGPLSGMPIFHSTGGEIMTVTPGPEKGTVTVHYEDSEQPGKLNTEIMVAKDLKALIKAQKRKPLPTPIP